jgi:SAM-dependent methyltransferase
MSFASERLFDRYYYSQPSFTDGTREFHHMIRGALGTVENILEIGSGPPNPTSTFLSSFAPVTGVDVSHDIESNAALSAALVFDGVTLPFVDESFDACVSNFVLEHVEHPAAHLSEVARVLRPGAPYVFRTPNLFHYVAGASRLLPHRVHVHMANRLRSLSADAHEPWQTFYRANSRGVLRRLASGAGLTVSDLRVVEKEPSYARSSVALFYPMMLYERTVNSTSLLEDFRATIFGALRKAASTPPRASSLRT